VQQIAVGAVQFDGVQAQRVGAARGVDEALLDALQAGGVERQRHGLALRMRHADGATVCQPRGWSGGMFAPPCHGTSLDALRPACASWIAILIGECRRIALMTGSSAAACSSDHRPRSSGVMRPSGVTAVASMISRPAPDRPGGRGGSCASRWRGRVGGVLAHRRDGDAVGQLERAQLIGENSMLMGQRLPFRVV
jgi:hypothetical protein